MTDDRADDETSVLPIAALPRPPATPPVAAAVPTAAPVTTPPAVVPNLEPAPPPYFGPAVTPVYPPYRPVPSAAPSASRVVFAGVVLLMFGVAQVVAGAAGAIFAGALRRVADQLLRDQGIRIEQAALGNVVATFFVVMLLVGVLHVVAAAAIFSQRTWGRVLGALLALLGIAICLVLLVSIGADPGSGQRAIAIMALLVPYAVSLLALVFAGAHFDRRRTRR